ncbi:transcription factor MUTE-like [Impatiens glandulifera]|uniref:transcription factor MUTE-like n=1 Tax=Impatiens glandulifera TaxID=253017 RepID=UPI001FB0D033|nr:transcription factor MUTE-like [Impatiens glandulifera]
MSHIAVERNRRRQMNEHLKVLRSLTPCFYIKRGDQASIIAGVVEFIKELHLVLQSLESKKQRKSISPKPKPKPNSNPSPRLSLVPQLAPAPRDIINPIILFGLVHESNNIGNNVKEFVASCNSPVADVEAKISGSNVILRTFSRRNPGQVVKIISVLEKFSFEILNLNISSMEDTVLYSFVAKIRLDCRLSVEELAFEVQQSFSSDILQLN